MSNITEMLQGCIHNINFSEIGTHLFAKIHCILVGSIGGTKAWHSYSQDALWWRIVNF